jgi:excisionase family DNA binding protein
LTEDFLLSIKRRMKLLNTTQAAERLGVSVRRVRALIAEGTLQAHQLGREYAIEEGALAHVTVYRKPGRPPASKAAKKSKKGAK